jgi:hypothetical protein
LIHACASWKTFHLFCAGCVCTGALAAARLGVKFVGCHEHRDLADVDTSLDTRERLGGAGRFAADGPDVKKSKTKDD